MGARVRIPDHIGWIVHLDFVLDEHPAPIEERNAPAYTPRSRLVTFGQVRDGKGAIGIRVEGNDRRLGFGVLIFATQGQGVMAFRLDSIISEAELAEVFRQIIIVSAQVKRPALAQGIKDESP